MMRGKLWWAVSGCLLLGLAHASESAQSVRKTAEATMLVTGHVQVNPDGSLKSYTIDQSEKLPEPVRDLIARSLPRWEFKLSGSTSDVVEANMTMRLLASPRPDGQFLASIQGASFADTGDSKGTTVSYKTQVQPHYPEQALRARVSGAVYVLVQIGRDGTVLDAVAEQVNLDQYGTEAEMKLYRKVLSTDALRAVKQWTFNQPTTGKDVDAPYWVARIPVTYSLHVVGSPSHVPGYGEWRVYIPGPRERAPWANQTLLSDTPDAMSDGAIHPLGGGLQLKTPLSGS